MPNKKPMKPPYFLVEVDDIKDTTWYGGPKTKWYSPSNFIVRYKRAKDGHFIYVSDPVPNRLEGTTCKHYETAIRHYDKLINTIDSHRYVRPRIVYITMEFEDYRTALYKSQRERFFAAEEEKKERKSLRAKEMFTDFSENWECYDNII